MRSWLIASLEKCIVYTYRKEAIDRTLTAYSKKETMAMKVRITTEYIDTETGEVLSSQRAESDNVPYEKFDFSTKEGILGPFGELEGTLLEVGHASMTGATQKYMEANADSKKKQKDAE